MWTIGTSVSWPILACGALGIATFALASLFRLHDVAAISVNLAATVAVSCSILCTCEPLRPLRFGNTAAGHLLVSWFFGQAEGPARWLACALGLALIALSLHPGSFLHRYGIWSYRPE